MKAFQFPDNFLFGSATAATQIEGGDKNNNWFQWCEKGHIKDGSSCLRANDHWKRYKDDIAWMKTLNHKVYRMGLEWSRIEPQKGKFDADAISRYRDELNLLIQNGIKPLVTLHHFSHPLWLCEEGAFENESILSYFERYTAHVVDSLGDLVSEYITINEPNVYTVFGYFFGEWPPGEKSLKKVLKVYKNMTLCHIKAYQIIHHLRKQKGFSEKTMVGIANHLRVFDPYSRKNPFDALAARIMEYLFQDAVIQSMSDGRLRFPIGVGAPLSKGKYYDFIGINYYTRSAVKFKGFENTTLPDTPTNDLDWEIYPEGLTRVIKKYYKLYSAPVWITENGTCDEKDAFRSKYLYDHLLQIFRLIGEGLPVERYYHWTLMDNFEWLEGEAARFGLIHVDYETQKRSLRKSGQFYGEICKENGVSDAMIQKYLL